MKNKELWDTGSALQILADPQADSTIWAEAVEWLIHYGPQEIQQILLAASAQATRSAYPELKPTAYLDDGTPCYKTEDLAQALGLSERQVAESMRQHEKEKDQQPASFMHEDHKIH